MRGLRFEGSILWNLRSFDMLTLNKVNPDAEPEGASMACGKFSFPVEKLI